MYLFGLWKEVKEIGDIHQASQTDPLRTLQWDLMVGDIRMALLYWLSVQQSML